MADDNKQRIEQQQRKAENRASEESQDAAREAKKDETREARKDEAREARKDETSEARKDETREARKDETREAEEAGNTVDQAAGQLQDHQIRALQSNFQRWQEVQAETFRAGADILFIQMDMMNRLTSCRRPDQVVGVGEDAYKAAQERMIACMDQFRDLASRQYEAVQDMATRQ